MTELSAMAGSMENIGRNCEFGMFQRDLGANQISLLRYSATPMEALITGLRDRFIGLGESMTGTPDPPGDPPERQEWWLTCERYGILFHSGQTVANTTIAQATAIIQQRLRWLAGKLLDDIAQGEKLFVYSSAMFRSPADAEPLSRAMRAIGPAWLLAVFPGTVCDTLPSGEVSCQEEGLIAACASRLTEVGDAASYDRASWEAIVTKAVPIWRRLKTPGTDSFVDQNRTGFDEAWYLSRNPDIADAVRSGGFGSGWDHYTLHGRDEGRQPAPTATAGSGKARS